MFPNTHRINNNNCVATASTFEPTLGMYWTGNGRMFCLCRLSIDSCLQVSDFNWQSHNVVKLIHWNELFVDELTVLCRVDDFFRIVFYLNYWSRPNDRPNEGRDDKKFLRINLVECNNWNWLRWRNEIRCSDSPVQKETWKQSSIFQSRNWGRSYVSLY